MQSKEHNISASFSSFSRKPHSKPCSSSVDLLYLTAHISLILSLYKRPNRLSRWAEQLSSSVTMQEWRMLSKRVISRVLWCSKGICFTATCTCVLPLLPVFGSQLWHRMSSSRLIRSLAFGDFAAPSVSWRSFSQGFMHSSCFACVISSISLWLQMTQVKITEWLNYSKIQWVIVSACL